jgi:hypothetical protein
MKSKDKNKKALKNNVIEQTNLDFNNLTPEQIDELVKKVSTELEANAHFEEINNTRNNTLPPWIHFT